MARVPVIRDIKPAQYKDRQRRAAREQLPQPSPDFAVHLKARTPEKDPDVIATFTAEPHKGGWQARGVLAQRGGAVVIAELTIKATGEAATRGVSRTLARNIPVATIHALAVGELRRRDFYRRERERFKVPPPDDALALKRAAAIAGEAAGTRGKGGRPPLPDELYRRVAETYLELLGEGWARGILKEIARREVVHYGRHVPRETVRDWVHRATELGYLTGRIRGKAFAEPGPRLLAEAENSNPQLETER